MNKLKKSLKCSERREKRKNKAAEMEEQMKYTKNRNYLKKIHQKLKYKKLNNQSYIGIKQKNMGIPSWEGKHSKITFDVLKNMDYNDFNIDDGEDFNPEDILNDEERKQHKKGKVVGNPQLYSISPMQAYSEKVINIKKTLKNVNNTDTEPNIKTKNKRNTVMEHPKVLAHNRNNTSMDAGKIYHDLGGERKRKPVGNKKGSMGMNNINRMAKQKYK
jgi:hypothetical protein